jgi:molybdate transport system regulatory protein
MKRVAGARLLVSEYRALLSKLIREGKSTIEERASLETYQSALDNLLAHEFKIRKARREKYYKRGKVALTVSNDQMRLSIRIDLTDGRIGPGKIALLKTISDVGSISGAARKMKMSYRKAWSLVKEISKLLEQPVITATMGGRDHGGAAITPAGEQMIAIYHAIESRVRGAVDGELKAIESLVRGG